MSIKDSVNRRNDLNQLKVVKIFVCFFNLNSLVFDDVKKVIEK